MFLISEKTMKKNRREVDIVVLSDIHLGTHGCHAKELLMYLKSIKPKILVLNGDIMDIWQFKKSYWPKTHMKIVKQIVSLASEGVKTYYITGNHDEILRKFSGLKLGSFHITNKLELKLHDGKAWFFHGDVFDVIIQNSKWIAKLGSAGYDLLIQLNLIINKLTKMLGKPKISMSKRIKDNVKTAVKYINNFEETAARVAQSKGYKYVVCGHIHKAQHRKIELDAGEIVYLNSGDWVENLTALEYHEGNWNVYQFSEDKDINSAFEKPDVSDAELSVVDLSPSILLSRMLTEFQS
jgi:UDP-2,3-diacylglucosamine pyrophosphatase LpxH